MLRLSKDDYYLGIAKAVSARSTCTRRRFGAVVVRDDAIVSTGYNGAARSVVNCLEVGCLKDEVGAPEYSGYDFCIGVHAEENAIINAARHGATVKDGILYIFGEYVKDRTFTEARPCERCKRAIINSGIEHVVTKKMDGSLGRYNVESWIKEDTKRYLDRLKKEREKRDQKRH